MMLVYRFRTMIPASNVTQRQQYIAIGIFITMADLPIIITGSYYFPVPFSSIVVGAFGCPAFLATWVYYEEKSIVRSQMKKPMCLMVGGYAALTMHEAIEVFYTSQKGFLWNQYAISLLLPVVKFMLRKFQMWVLKGSDGLGTTVIAFEVQFFSSLYASVFMQNADNPITLLIIVLLDFSENGYHLYKLVMLVKDQKKNISKFSRELEYLLLFRTEKIVLFEFVEVCTPIMYGIYRVAIRNHPNFVYIKGLRDTPIEEFTASIWNLAILASLELLSFIIFLAVLQAKYGLPLFNQLGFTIERYKGMIISTMSFWFLVATAAQMEHLGSDYTFQFGWLH